ncbi:MAG TPA: 1-acyl-sn-glycerol-3-phosphate acyltransferase, partial [Terrabacter sp.]|nr:1-acyl-sn-glycerol-3-phosphate acyltransferase [Terrabacter sp.]
LYGRPIDTKVLREATDRLMDHITGLLEVLREEKRPTERFDPRRHGVPEVGNPLRHDDIGRSRPLEPGEGDTA